MFTHEVVVPLVSANPVQREAPLPSAPEPSPAPQRTFLPGSEWLYAKLYVSEASADTILVEDIVPLVQEARAVGIDRWFFIRYADPEPHLRIRFRGDPSKLFPHVLTRLHALAARRQSSGLVRRLELATYEREVERYGGGALIDIAERIFELDSDATLSALETIHLSDDTEATRFAYSFACMRSILDEFAPTTRLDIAEALYDRYVHEHAASVTLTTSVGAWARHPPLDLSNSSLNDCAAKLALSIRSLIRQLPPDTRMSTVPSFLHMMANRIFPWRPRTYELLVTRVLRDSCRKNLRALKERASPYEME